MKHRHNYILVLLLLTLWVSNFTKTQAQPGQGQGYAMTTGWIKGFVFDSKNNKPVEYANVVLYSKRSQEQVTGTITDTEGFFHLTDLRPGMYILEIKFIGFDAFTIDTILLRPNKSEINLGRIEITPDVLAMGSVEVLGEKPIIEFQIDKKVINVSKQFTSLSGTAVDVLENVPSVSVDIEGNVSLRGSGSFNLLIDGRPSVLDANDALQTIPASTIENIEIVTNPSAKYDPDGVAGIINIITKKNKSNGIAGITNLNVGTFNNIGGDFLFSLRNKKTNYYIGADLSRRNMPGNMHSEKWTSTTDTINYLNSDGNSEWGGIHGSIRGGVDIDITPSDLFRLGFRYGVRSHDRDFESDFLKWSIPGDTTTYSSFSSGERSGKFYSLNLDYVHKFGKEGHEISSQFNIRRRDMDEKSLSKLYDENQDLYSGQKSTESGPGTRAEYKIDYVLPINEDDKIEAGYQTRYSLSEDDNTMAFLNTATGNFDIDDSLVSSTDYERWIQSTYLIYAGNIGNFGFQGGLRGEYTYRNITMTGVEDAFSIDRWDIYPTLHSSYKFGDQQFMASYARRIERIRGWHLEPFLTWMDAYNVRRGNPALKPEYIDSYEAGYQRSIGKSLISLEAYYRITHNKIDRVQTVYSENILLHSFENVGKDYALGTEMMLSVSPYKWWNLNIMGNIYDYRVIGTLYGETINTGSFNWSARLNNTFRFTKSSRIQLNGMYSSPTVTAQGRSEGMFFTNIAFRQDFMDRKFSLTFQLRDLLGTARHEFTSEGPNFYSYNNFNRQPRMLSITLTYNINNYKTERERNGQGDENNIEFDEGDNGNF